jgi:hypothetical protein
MPQQEEGKVKGISPRVIGRVARKVLKVEEAIGMAMGMAIRVEGMEMGKTGEKRLRWPITTLQGFSRRGIPLHQIRLRMALSRKPLIAVQPRMCSSLQ